MKKATKVWLITASFLVLVGLILFACVISRLGWNFTKLFTTEYETNTYEVSEAFDNISIHTDTAELIFALSDDGKCSVVCREGENETHSVAVENNTLVVSVNKSAKHWYDYLRFDFASPTVTVYLPKTAYTSLLIAEHTGDVEVPNAFLFKNADISLSTGNVHFCASASEAVKINTSTGAICAENLSAGSLELKVTTGAVTVSGATCESDVTIGVSTGKTALSDTRCKNLVSSGSTGSISIENVIAEETFSIKRSTGAVKFIGSDAAEIFVKTSTGNVTGSLLSDKVFITQTDTGNVDVPKTTAGGKCEITTDTGNIRINID